MIAGPIIRYRQIEDQIRTPPPRRRRLDDIAEGFPRFALGLCKKVLIADQVAPIANGPYSAVSMTDFWRRWHITLSRWFRDYVYIPLGGSRVSQSVTARNLLFVFLLVGAWHGAAWTFVLWGVYNGTLVVAERLSGISALPNERLAALRRAGTLLLVVAGWVLFRAKNLGDAGDVYAAMVGFETGPLPAAVSDALSPQPVLALGIGLVSVLLPRGMVLGRVLQGEWTGPALGARVAVVAAAPLAAISVAAGSFSPFLYFQF